MTPEIMHELMVGLAMIVFIIGGVILLLKFMEPDE